ncbi:MAG: DUF2061 domain-containing protein [Lentimicrobium sp.]|nr:DUF2061 domain-containing protein [Lentimicrobium sp.]
MRKFVLLRIDNYVHFMTNNSIKNISSGPPEEDQPIFRDSPQRSFIKAITYRVLASGVMFIVFFIIFRSTTKRTLNESLGDATLISIIDFVVKLAIYYFHERVWSGIKWGKYWKRNYWARRAWKKAYRKAHK